MRHKHFVTVAAEAKSLSHLASRERRATLQRAVVAVLDIIGVAVSRPPANEPRWNRSAARLALAIATDRVERRDLLACERAIEDFYFVDQSVELAGPVIDFAAADIEWLIIAIDSSRPFELLLTYDQSVGVDRDCRSIESECDMSPLIVRRNETGSVGRVV